MQDDGRRFSFGRGRRAFLASFSVSSTPDPWAGLKLDLIKQFETKPQLRLPLSPPGHQVVNYNRRISDRETGARQYSEAV